MGFGVYFPQPTSNFRNSVGSVLLACGEQAEVTFIAVAEFSDNVLSSGTIGVYPYFLACHYYWSTVRAEGDNANRWVGAVIGVEVTERTANPEQRASQTERQLQGRQCLEALPCFQWN